MILLLQLLLSYPECIYSCLITLCGDASLKCLTLGTSIICTLCRCQAQTPIHGNSAVENGSVSITTCTIYSSIRPELSTSSTNHIDTLVSCSIFWKWVWYWIIMFDATVKLIKISWQPRISYIFLTIPREIRRQSAIRTWIVIIWLIAIAYIRVCIPTQCGPYGDAHITDHDGSGDKQFRDQHFLYRCRIMVWSRSFVGGHIL